MPRYTVTRVITEVVDIDADSPEEAIESALELHDSEWVTIDSDYDALTFDHVRTEPAA